MRILAVDTTSAHGSVAVIDSHHLEGVIGFRTRRPQHAERLLPTIDTLLSWLEIPLSQVSGFAVAVGPGSFTGLRIGIAALEGLAYACSRPVVGVSALEACAYRYRYLRGTVLAVIDAYRGEVYAAWYRTDGCHLAEIAPAVCQPPDRVLQALDEKPDIIAGSGAARYQALFQDRSDPGVVIARPSFFIAEEVARLGLEKLTRGEGAALGGLEALYVRPSDAQIHVAKERSGS